MVQFLCAIGSSNSDTFLERPIGASLGASMVAQLQETRVQSLDQEDSPERETATHSSILAWEIPWTEEPGGLQSIGLQRVKYR